MTALTFDEFRATREFKLFGDKDVDLNGPGYVYADGCHIDLTVDRETADIFAHLTIFNQQWSLPIYGLSELEKTLYEEFYLTECV